MRGTATRGNTIAFGQFALQAQECGWITSRQIEASRRAMTRQVKRGGKIWIRIFPDKPVTMRAAETRMGSGKGNPEFWVAVIKPGRILFEMGGPEITEAIARAAMRLAQTRSSISALKSWAVRQVAGVPSPCLRRTSRRPMPTRLRAGWLRGRRDERAWLPERPVPYDGFTFPVQGDSHAHHPTRGQAR